MEQTGATHYSRYHSRLSPHTPHPDLTSLVPLIASLSISTLLQVMAKEKAEEEKKKLEMIQPSDR